MEKKITIVREPARISRIGKLCKKSKSQITNLG